MEEQEGQGWELMMHLGGLRKAYEAAMLAGTVVVERSLR